MEDHRAFTNLPLGGPYPAPTEQTRKKKKRTCGWCLSSHELKERDGWFKSPRDTTWTIDSTVNGKAKPSGYDSNSLITILRSSQCLCAVLVIISYICTLSAPTFWLIILGSVVGVLSSGWSICALFLRHRWSVYLAIPEILIAIAWIVLFAASSTAVPDEAKSGAFHFAVMAIEASMVLWIQTCLLVATPFFHKLMPWLFRVPNRGNTKPGCLMHGAQEMPTLPRDGSTISAGAPGFPSDIPVIASPQPTYRGPRISPIGMEDYRPAQRTDSPRRLAGSVTIPRQPTGHRAAPFDELLKTADELVAATADRSHASKGTRSVSPVSSIYSREAVEPVSPLTVRSSSLYSVDMGDRRRPAGPITNPWDTASLQRSETRIGR
ncbi:hypothetical protein F5Y04DRAFT_282236 [Hypomontagnella monticulosa]|nr:hypothetical protein F5Y04DRAFT_282236 [Hypomontagnella monticulosa]